ncbi:ribonucleoside diphosphate reductase subunit beta [Alishewanella phage vB_AspM_Slickus01]|nr:ribonucleoside diphosphate reductase subunit beta [Alishewanella phage vB_AspM_Slickus01]
MRSVFPTEHTDYTKEFMFFGKEPNINRNDVMKYPKLSDFTTQQLSFFWRPEEIDCTKDRVDYLKMEEHEKHIFISNIKYQSLLDSVQGRAPLMVLGQIVSLPELETWLTTWQFSETIHEQSYTHILRNVFRDPTPIFDTVLDIPEIISRAKSVTKHYDDLYFDICRYNAGLEVDLYQMKVKLFKCLVTIYFLESIRFYASFVSTFSFAKRGVMEGQGKIMQLIARDEYVHQGSTHYMITRYLGGLDDPEMVEIARNHVQFIIDTGKEVCEQEKMWADYLFQYGSTIGLNAAIVKSYQMWLTDQRIRDLLCAKVQGKNLDFGYTSIYNIKSNPIPWINEFLESDNVQVAPQETEMSSYLIGQVCADLDDDFLGDLEL